MSFQHLLLEMSQSRLLIVLLWNQSEAKQFQLSDRKKSSHPLTIVLFLPPYPRIQAEDLRKTVISYLWASYIVLFFTTAYDGMEDSDDEKSSGSDVVGSLS